MKVKPNVSGKGAMFVLSLQSDTVDHAAYTQLHTLFVALPQTVWPVVLLGAAP